MTGHYKKPAEAGKLFPCKKCGKTATAGQDRYFEKIEVDGPDGSKTEVWIGCIDFECFKSQGGSATPAEQKKFMPTKFPLQSVGAIKDIAFGLIDDFEKKYSTSTTPQKLSMENKAIMFESLFRTVSSNFKP